MTHKNGCSTILPLPTEAATEEEDHINDDVMVLLRKT